MNLFFSPGDSQWDILPGTDSPRENWLMSASPARPDLRGSNPLSYTPRHTMTDG